MVNDRDEASHTPLALQPGDRLTVHPPAQGVRNYLAVRGGIKIAKDLGQPLLPMYCPASARRRCMRDRS